MRRLTVPEVSESRASEQARNSSILLAALNDAPVDGFAELLLPVAVRASAVVGTLQTRLLLGAARSTSECEDILEAARRLRRPLRSEGVAIANVARAFLDALLALRRVFPSADRHDTYRLLELADAQKEPRYLPNAFARFVDASRDGYMASASGLVSGFVELKKSQLRAIVRAPDYGIRRALRTRPDYAAKEFEALRLVASGAGLTIADLEKLLSETSTFREFCQALAAVVALREVSRATAQVLVRVAFST